MLVGCFTMEGIQYLLECLSLGCQVYTLIWAVFHHNLSFSWSWNARFLYDSYECVDFLNIQGVVATTIKFKQ